MDNSVSYMKGRKKNHESKNVITKKHHHSDGNLKILTNQRSSTNLQFARCSWRCFHRWAEHSGVGASEILISRRLRIALAEKEHLESATGNRVESAPQKRTSAKRLRRSRVVRSRSVSEPISEGTTWLLPNLPFDESNNLLYCWSHLIHLQSSYSPFRRGLFSSK